MYVELKPHTTPIFSGELPPHQVAALHAMYAYVGKIQAIRWLRTAYPGSTLTSTKDAIEALARHYGWQQLPFDDNTKSLGEILIEAVARSAA